MQALKEINLDVEQGDFFALLGPNGAGKSTTIGVITSLVTKSTGSIQVFDTDLDIDAEQAKSYIGLVPQEFNFNGFEQVKHILVAQAGYYGMPASQAEPRADELLKQLGLWEKRDTPSRSLSGGMKRRLMIARALVHNPRLLILDEPTEGLDPNQRVSMRNLIKSLGKQRTIMLSTHVLQEVESTCSRIILINKGKIITEGTVEEILNSQNKNQTIQLEIIGKDIHTKLNSINGIEDIEIIENEETIKKFIISIEENSDPRKDIFKKAVQENWTLLTMSKTSPKLEDVFKFLYRNLEFWGNSSDKQDEAIVIIRNGLVKHGMIADPEINLSATLIELENISN